MSVIRRPSGLAQRSRFAGRFDLGHDVLGQVPGQLRRPGRDVAGEERGGDRQRGVPAVLPDRLQERADRRNGVRAGTMPDRLAGEPGEVAFQQRPVDAVQGCCSGDGKELAEPGEGGDIRLHGADAEARAQPQPGPPFGQVAEPGLGKAVETQPDPRVSGLSRVQDQSRDPVQPPDVAGVLGFPAGALGQFLDHVAGEQQERRVGRALASARLPPPLVLGQVEQRFHAGVAGPADRPPGDLVREGDGRPARPALDRVLHLEPELGREAAEVDPGPAAQHAVLGELAGIGGTQLPPPGVVGLAELVGLVLGPQRAERQQALRPRLRRGRLGPRRPCGRVRASRMLPGRAVPHAQTLAAAAVMAAGHRAGRQRAAAVQRRARVGEECRHVRAAAVVPPFPVRGAKAVLRPGPVAAAGRAGRPAQDRVVRAGDQDVRAELDADGGKEPFQQPRPPGCGLLRGRGHQASSCSKTVAVRRTVTPPLRSAACSRDVPPPPGCSRHSPSPSACRQAANACRTCGAGASPLTWPMSYRAGRADGPGNAGQFRVALQDPGQLGGRLPLPGRAIGLGDDRGHSRTSCPVNQPASSST